MLSKMLNTSSKHKLRNYHWLWLLLIFAGLLELFYITCHSAGRGKPNQVLIDKSPMVQEDGRLTTLVIAEPMQQGLHLLVQTDS